MRPSWHLLFVCLLLLPGLGEAWAAPPGEEPLLVLPLPNFDARYTTDSEPPFPLNKAGVDSFDLYGGPGIPEGKFQDGSGFVPDRQGWLGVDLTDQPTRWQHSMYNMENLNNHGADNWGMWCGVDCGDLGGESSGWSHCPGYGNGWNALLRFEATVTNPAVGQTVGLEFFFNHDTEPAYDFLVVEYDSAGSWISVCELSGSNKELSGGTASWTAPGLLYSEHATGDIDYVGNDYGGETNDQIRIQIVVRSDMAWSDEDGQWPTHGGAAQVDDITVSYDDGSAKQTQTVFEDFEGGLSPYWIAVKGPFVGDFSKVFYGLSDNDPCAENGSPLMTFVDNGTPPSNPANDPPLSTGGMRSLNWDYGFPDGWVCNFEGGLSDGQLSLLNEVWSPEIVWDLPSTTGDDPAIYAGSLLRFDVWRHLPFYNGFFYVWHVRSTCDNGNRWTPWRDHELVYYGGDHQGGIGGDWKRCTYDTSTLVGPDPDTGDPPDHVQIALGVWDLADLFGLPGNDATPSPCFDNVNFVKYAVDGPTFSARTYDLFQDAFPHSGSLDVSTQGTRDALDCRIDMARDVGGLTSIANVHGDSLIVDIRAVIAGTSIVPEDLLLKWRLLVNPLFETDIRGNLTGFPGVVHTDNPDPQWDHYEGQVAAQVSTTSEGAVVADRYFWDLPDEDFAYPGDILYYYVEATDNELRTTTLPPSIEGFGSDAYHRAFTVRFLPTVVFDQDPPYVLPENGGAVRQPQILVINDFGHRGGEDALHGAFGQNGYLEDVDYDSYTVKAPSSMVSNGIGASGSGGANAEQLAGYGCLLYVCENLADGLLSDGSGDPGNDKSQDLDVLTAWKDIPGDRCIAYFGDNVVSGHSGYGAAGFTYVNNEMGVVLADNNVHDEIEGQQTPVIAPVLAEFAEEFVGYGGCLDMNTFDSIRPVNGAVAGHLFRRRDGEPDMSGPVASVVFDRIEQFGPDSYRRVDITFPYGFSYVYDVPAKEGDLSSRAKLLHEILEYFAAPSPSGSATQADPIPLRGVRELRTEPNPFNPSTTVRFTLGVGGPVRATVYDLRGRAVRVLCDETREAGPQELTWDGRDRSGVTVASGVYVVRVEGNGDIRQRKIALVK